ncbi:MAG: 50S ribosomal protein L4 [Bacilli bacterium]|jgi:large subunit ribosomal protein L4|nr:50S ribosomal protein L4 [Bacilli bacterium]
MAKVELKNLKNEKVKDLSISDSIWKIEVNDDCLKKMIRLQLAATRQGTAKTKTRSEVSGGGRKPWKQKGTGRARQGSIRATQWRGGGIAGGVQPRDYTFKINKKERVLALKSALTDKLNTKSLFVFDNLELPSLKTKELKSFVETANLEGKVLFVTASDNENLYMASRNLGYTYVLYIDDINVYDIVNADTLVLDEAALNKLEEVLKNA